jgi:hypothetical protein
MYEHSFDSDFLLSVGVILSFFIDSILLLSEGNFTDSVYLFLYLQTLFVKYKHPFDSDVVL